MTIENCIVLSTERDLDAEWTARNGWSLCSIHGASLDTAARRDDVQSSAGNGMQPPENLVQKRDMECEAPVISAAVKHATCLPHQRNLFHLVSYRTPPAAWDVHVVDVQQRTQFSGLPRLRVEGIPERLSSEHVGQHGFHRESDHLQLLPLPDH